MAAVVRIQTTPQVGLSREFTALFAAQVRARGRDSVALLLPTSRAAALARRVLLEDEDLPGLFDPRLLTFPQMAQALLTAAHHPSRQLTAVQRELLVQEVLEELQGEPALQALHARADRPGVVRAVCGLLDELKSATVSSEQFAAAAHRALPGHLSHEAVARLYRDYQQRLHALKLYDQPGLFWEALEVLRDHLEPYEALEVLLVDGFEDFTTGQIEVLKALAQRLQRIEIRVLLDRQREAMFPRGRATVEQLQRELGATVVAEASGPTGPRDLDRLRTQVFGSTSALLTGADGSVRLLEVAGGIMGECREVARQVKLLLTAPDAPPAHALGLVLRSWESGHEAALRELLPAFGVPAEFSRGPRPADLPAVQAALAVLDVLGEWRREHVVKLLNNSYVDARAVLPEGLTPWQLERTALQAGIIGGRWEDWEQGFRRLAETLTQERTARREWERTQGLDEAERERSFEDDDGNRYRPLGEIEREQRELERCGRGLQALRQLLKPLENAVSLAGAAAAFGAVLAQLRIAERAGVTAKDETLRRRAAFDLRGLEALGDALREIAEAPQVLGLGRAREGASQRGALLDFTQAVRAACAGQRLVGERRAHSGVQVLEVSEVRHERFHTVFICGLRDGLFPGAGRQDPFYTDDDRARMQSRISGLRPRVAGRFQDASLFYAALSAAEECVWLTYPLTEADGKPVLRSPYVVEVLRHWQSDEETLPEGLLQSRRQSQVLTALGEVCRRAEALETLAAKKLLPPEQEALAAALRENLDGDGFRPRPADLTPLARIERLRRDADWEPDVYSGQLPAEIVASLAEQYGPQRVFSPSRLNLYAACPMRFFLQQVLGLEALGELSEALERRELGNLAHRILAVFYGQRLVGRDDCEPITGANLEAARTALRAVIGQVCAPGARPAGCDPGVWEQTVARLTENLLALLEYDACQNEREEPKRGGTWSPPRQVLAVEASYGRNRDFSVPTPSGPVLVSGRLDRIDLTVYEERDYFVLFDYKTTRGIGKGLVLAGADVQLPLYAMAARQLMAGRAEAVFMWGCQRLERPVGWVTMMRRKGTDAVDDLDRAEQVACAKIGEYVSGIREGRFAPEPNVLLSPCRTCDFRGICRVQ